MPREAVSVFVPNYFLDLGSRETVDMALRRLARKGTIRRLACGVYNFRPRDTRSARGIQRGGGPALAGRDRTRLQPAGVYAENILGLSKQVPAKAVFLTDGPSRTVQIGPTTILLRRITPGNMEAAWRLTGLLIQALRELGEKHLIREQPEHCCQTITRKGREDKMNYLRMPSIDPRF